PASLALGRGRTWLGETYATGKRAGAGLVTLAHKEFGLGGVHVERLLAGLLRMDISSSQNSINVVVVTKQNGDAIGLDGPRRFFDAGRLQHSLSRFFGNQGTLCRQGNVVFVRRYKANRRLKRKQVGMRVVACTHSRAIRLISVKLDLLSGFS